MTGDAILSSPAIGTSPSDVIRPRGDRTRPAPPSWSRFHRNELPLPGLGSGPPP